MCVHRLVFDVLVADADGFEFLPFSEIKYLGMVVIIYVTLV